jgi:hypothetical protein
MSNCKNCEKETPNPKFCSKSCSASYNNAITPRRKLTKLCKGCEELIPARLTFCSKECGNIHRNQKSLEDWGKLTLAEVKGSGSANAGSRYPYIRAFSRKTYLLSNMGNHCAVCGYDLHFEVAHIKQVQSFDENTPVSVVNDLSNLVALCRNHHWEFDNGHLDITPFI